MRGYHTCICNSRIGHPSLPVPILHTSIYATNDRIVRSSPKKRAQAMCFLQGLVHCSLPIFATVRNLAYLFHLELTRFDDARSLSNPFLHRFGHPALRHQEIRSMAKQGVTSVRRTTRLWAREWLNLNNSRQRGIDIFVPGYNLGHTCFHRHPDLVPPTSAAVASKYTTRFNACDASCNLCRSPG